MQKRRYRKYWKWIKRERAKVIKRVTAQFKEQLKASAIIATLIGPFDFLDTAIEMTRKEQDQAARDARGRQNEMKVYELGIWNDAPVLGIPLPEPDETFFYGPNGELLMNWHPDDYKFWLAAPAPGETLEQFHERLNKKKNESNNPA